MSPKKTDSVIFNTATAAETGRIAAKLARCLAGGEIICLYGPIGSGKTVFTQALAAGLGVKKLPASASFALMRGYKGRLRLFHFDLFRVCENELFNLGIEECIGRDDAVTVIEWADPAKRLLPPERIEMRFALAGGDKRRIKVKASKKTASAVRRALSL